MNILRNQNGTALIITLTIMALLTAVAIMAVNRSSTDVEISFNQQHDDKSFYIAEAGAKTAFYKLNDSIDWRSGYNRVNYGEGFYNVDLVDSFTDGSLYDTVLIQATGNYDGAVSYIEYETVPEYKHPFQYAMFAESGIAIDRDACTDSYNSDSGSYADTYLDSLGSIGTNGTITTSKDVYIGGDLQSATDGGISLGSNTTVTGDTTSAMDSVNLDLIPASEYEWAKLNSDALTGISGSNFSYNSGTRNLTTGSSGSVELQSGVYYFSSITMGQDSKLTLAPGADVTIYVTGDVILNQNSTLNDGGDPADLIVYSDGSTLQFDQGNTFVGGFYGPNAHIQYDQTTQVYGSLVGNTIKMDKGACFHYDRNLANIQKGKTGSAILTAWSEEF